MFSPLNCALGEIMETGNHCIINELQISKFCFRPTPDALDWARELPGFRPQIPAADI